RLGEGLLDARREFVLGQPALEAKLWRDAGDQAGLGARQVVRRRLAVDHDRLADFVEFGIGADGCELRGPVAPRLRAEGFVVVPEKGVLHAADSRPYSSGENRRAVASPSRRTKLWRRCAWTAAD